MPWNANMPVTMSAMATPSLKGGPPASPVMLMRPPSAWITASYPASSRRGPVWPKPEIEQ